MDSHFGCVIVFDGLCNLCSRWVDFVMRNDKARKIKFASLQSEIGKNLLLERGIAVGESSTVYFLENEKAWSRSKAVLKILKNLGFAWSFFYIFIIVPPFIRDAAYEWVSRNRYRWFGRRQTCRPPRLDEAGRFLG